MNSKPLKLQDSKVLNAACVLLILVSLAYVLHLWEKNTLTIRGPYVLEYVSLTAFEVLDGSS
jgi:hypothetical protein